MRVRLLSLAVIALIVVPTFAPVAHAEWDDDNWLWNLIGPERLEMGDEFGCHGFEGVDITKEAWPIVQCKEYLNEFTDASRWGKQPISFGFSGVVDDNLGEELIENGFWIVGDRVDSAPEEILVINRNGGSLEKNQVDRDAIENAEKDSFLSIYWIARVHDIKVREDKDAIELIESQNVWFTTWGEWANHFVAGQQFNLTINDEIIHLSLPSRSDWAVPGSILLSFNEEVISVEKEGSAFPQLSVEDRHLKEGWRAVSEGIIVTLAPGEQLEIVLSSEPETVTETPLRTFNDLHHSVTIVGHHVTNLHEWSSDFHDSELRFTWLIERPLALEMDWRLPIIGLIVLIATPATIYYLVKQDQKSRKE